MIKFSESNSFDFGVASSQLIKDTSCLTKRAASESLVRDLLKVAKTPGQEDIHLIALGAYEGTGFNRNMDCFMEYWCEKNAHYFKKADRAVNKHHKNKPTDPKYGNIKAAAYNKAMRRVELVVGIDKKGGEEILHEQEKTGNSNWSMASKQAHDVCTWCKHKAYSDVDRCSHIPDKLGEMNKLGQLCGMENPDPKWFEISWVKRPADRIGMSLQKMAGNKLQYLLPKDYLQIYTGFSAPSDDIVVLSKSAEEKRELLKKLSELEKRIDAEGKDLSSLATTEKLAGVTLDELRALPTEVFFKLAAEAAIILSPDNFFSYLFNDKVKEAEVNQAKAVLKSTFSDLEKDAELVNSEVFDIRPLTIANNTEKTLISKLAEALSLDSKFDTLRLSRYAFPKIKLSQEAESPHCRELARQYTNYKLAALTYLKSKNMLTDDLLITSVIQNR